jgi:hypothetical protein
MRAGIHFIARRRRDDVDPHRARSKTAQHSEEWVQAARRGSIFLSSLLI